MKWEADYLRNEIRDLGVDVKMCHVPTLEELKEYNVVLNATGAKSFVPEVNGMAEKVVAMEDAFACPKVTCEFYPKDSKRMPAKLGEKVIVWGDHYGAADLVAYLGAIGKDVTVVTDRKEFGSSVEVIHMYVLRKRMAQGDAEALESKPYKFPVKVFQNATLYSIGDKEVKIIENGMKITTIPADDIVTCYTKPNTEMAELFGKLEAAGVPVVTVGDAKSVRNLHAAVKEGAQFIIRLNPEHYIKNPNDALIDDLPLDVKGALGY
jgi:thioredoxin reductase